MMSIKRYNDGDYLPLNRYDGARKTDRKPERQDGAGAIFWIVVMFLCNVLLALIGVHYG